MDGQPRWQIREEALDQWGMSILSDLYAAYPTLFSIKLHHGGALSKFPGRKYVGGTTAFVDQVNSDYFSVHEIDRMVVKLGYSEKDKVYYHFKRPGCNLDFGLVALGNDQDVLHMLSFLGKIRVVFVYIEHGITTVSTYFRSPIKNKGVVIEELDDEPVERKVVPKKRRKRLYLEWKDEGQTSASKDKVLDGQMEDKTGEDNDEILGPDNVENLGQHDEVDANPFDNVENNLGQDDEVDANITGNVENLGQDDEQHENPFDDDFFNDEQHETHCDANESDGEPVFDDVDATEAPVDDDFDNTEATVDANITGKNDATKPGVDENEADFQEDEINQLHDVEVDMSTFNCNVNRVSHRDREVNPEEDVSNDEVGNDEVLGFDFDEFDSGDEDGQPDRDRRRKLKVSRREQQASDPELVKSPFYVGQKFFKKKEVTELVRAHAIATRRDLRCIKNDLERVRARCCGATPGYIPPEKPQKEKAVEGDKGNSGKGDKYKGKKVILESKIPDKPTCPWTLHVSKGKNEDVWLVKTLIEDHKCTLTRELSQCTSTFLAKHVSQIVKSTPEVSGKGLKDLLEKQLQLGINQNIIYKAKQKAQLQMKCAFQDQYNLLRDYILELQQMNPDTTVKIEVQPESNPGSETRVFKRIYVCIGALKNGFKAGKRELIGLDGAFIKGPYPGQVLTAVGVDSNNGIYPVAYAVVESENLNSWTWFLTCLGDDLGLERNSNFTFITDRQKGLIPALAKVFPVAEHRFCLRHVYENLVKKFKGSGYKELVWKCATKTTLREFEEAMEELKNYDAPAHDWLRAIPLSSWARAHFTGRAHCDILLNNICESFNSKIVDGREQPIITCLEYIREYLMKRIVLVQKVQEKSHGTLTPAATLIFENIKRKAGEYIVTWNGGDMYQCNGPWDEQVVVNLRTKECACRRWELTGIPCKHAVASLWNMSMNGSDIGLIEDWVHPCYRLDTWKEAYSFKIQPTNGRKMWPKSQCPTRLLPSNHHTPIGRPKKKRTRGVNEPPLVTGGKLTRFGKSITCGKCGGRGHNQSTCKGEGGQSSQSQNQTQSQPQSQSQSQSQSQTQNQVKRKAVGRGRGRGIGGSQTGRGVGQGGSGSSQTGTSQMGRGSQIGRGRGRGRGQGRGGRKAFGGWI